MAEVVEVPEVAGLQKLAHQSDVLFTLMASALLGMIIFMAVVNVFGNYKKVRTESETSSEVPMSTENHAAHVKEPSTV